MMTHMSHIRPGVESSPVGSASSCTASCATWANTHIGVFVCCCGCGPEQGNKARVCCVEIYGEVLKEDHLRKLRSKTRMHLAHLKNLRFMNFRQNHWKELECLWELTKCCFNNTFQSSLQQQCEGFSPVKHKTISFWKHFSLFHFILAWFSFSC